jgi:hypothetical protein
MAPPTRRSPNPRSRRQSAERPPFLSAFFAFFRFARGARAFAGGRFARKFARAAVSDARFFAFRLARARFLFAGHRADEALAVVGGRRGRAVFAHRFGAVGAGEGPFLATRGRAAVFTHRRRWRRGLRASLAGWVLGAVPAGATGRRPAGGLVRRLRAGVGGTLASRVGGRRRTAGLAGLGERLGRSQEHRREHAQRQGEHRDRGESPGFWAGRHGANRGRRARCIWRRAPPGLSSVHAAGASSSGGRWTKGRARSRRGRRTNVPSAAISNFLSPSRTGGVRSCP